jgi:hypothetical protein
MISCNLLSPQVFWFKRARTSIPVLFVVSILVNIGMWFERFVIVVTSLHRDFLPSSWDYFSPTLWDVATMAGSFGLFFTLFCLFVRYFPMVAMAELKTVLPEAQVHLETSEVENVSSATAPMRKETESSEGIHGLLAEFSAPGDLLRAAHKVRQAEYTRWDAHSPFPVHGLERAMGQARSKVPWFVLIMGLTGAAAGMILQWWVSSVAYPLVISGKPLFSWPAFVPITFECGVLGGGLGALIGFLFLSKLPEHYHPLFNSKHFEAVSDDKFFISIEADDPRFERETTERLLLDLGANRVELIRT